MHTTKPATAAAAALALSAGLATAAQAQSRCGARYAVEPGDTLYGISQSCRVTLARIMDLNPSLGDPRDIAVGTELRLEAEAGRAPASADAAGDAAARAPAEGYRVKEGETFSSIAQALGVGLVELIDENPDLDPFALAAGERLDVPGDGAGATVSIDSRSGPPGTDVTVRARNLRPNDWVTVGVGPRSSEWSPLREVQADAEGTLAAEVEVPDRAEPEQMLIFVVDTDRGVTLKSGAFDVAAEDDSAGQLVLEGRVGEGAECPTLTTPDGDTWSLAGAGGGVTPGEYVEVEGRRADLSFCMAGVGTIDVGSIEEVAPPAGGT